MKLDMRKSRQYLNIGEYSVYVYLYRNINRLDFGVNGTSMHYSIDNYGNYDKNYLLNDIITTIKKESEDKIGRIQVEYYSTILEKNIRKRCDNEKETLLKYLIEEIGYNYIDNLLNYDDYKNVKLLTVEDIVKIAENMCNLYYFNEGVNEIISDNISDYLYKNCVKEGSKDE